MLSEARAREIAEDFASGRPLDPVVTELERGWYFAWGPEPEFIGGGHGLVVNKETGRVFVVGSRFGVERDLQMYDLGMDAEKHDLVILDCRP